MARLLFYLPSIAITAVIVYRVLVGAATPTLTWLLLIPAFLIINTLVNLMLLRLFATGHTVYKELFQERKFYGLAYVLVFIIGPIFYIFYSSGG